MKPLIRDLRFNCPLCKEERAYVSSTYPDLIVCKCSGKLVEVGTLDKNSLELKNAELTSNLKSKFELKHLKNMDEVMLMGTEFKNALSSEGTCRRYMQMGDIYQALYNNDETHAFSVMFYIDKTTRVAQNFKRHLNKKVPDDHINMIVSLLKEAGVKISN